MKETWMKPKEKFIVLIVFLLALCILPAYETVWNRLYSVIDTEDTSETIPHYLKKGDVIEQTILVDDGAALQDIQLRLRSDKRYDNEGCLLVTLSQGSYQWQMKIDPSFLIADEYKSLNADYTKFRPGTIKISIEVPDLTPESVIQVLLAKTVIVGIDSAKINGIDAEGILSLKYKVRDPGKPFANSMVQVIIIIALIIFSSYIMSYLPENSKTGWLLLILLAGLIFFLITLYYPGYSFGGLAWAEGATFFFDSAKNNNVFHMLTSLEGNMYLSTLNQLFAIIVVKVLHLQKYAFVALQSMALVFKSLCVTPFCSHYFKNILTREIRFACALVAACYIFQDYTYIGTAYFGGFFLLLTFVCNFEKIHNVIYGIILAMIAIICTSKMYFVVFFPTAIVYYILCRKEMNTKKKISVAFIAVFSFLEGLLSVLFTSGVQSGARLGSLQTVSLIELISKCAYYFVQLFYSVILHGMNFTNQFQISVIAILGVAALVFATLRNIVRKGKYDREFKLIAVLMSLIVFQNILTLFTTTDWHGEIRWDTLAIQVIYEHNANSYIAVCAIYLILFSVVCKYVYHLCLKESKSRMLQNSMIAIAAVGIVCCCNQYPAARDKNHGTDINVMRSDWKTYSFMADKDSFCIRIDPNRWYYTKNSAYSTIPLQDMCSEVSLTNERDLEGKSKFVFYVHKSRNANQVQDQYYYMNIYGKDGKLRKQIRQLNDNISREYICFYLDKSIKNVEKITFENKKGEALYVDEELIVGYKAV